MTTTCVRNSIVGDQWIYQTAQQVPIQHVIGDDGNPTGDILTGPVRLAFDNLFDLPQPTKDMPNPKFGASILFTPYADFTLLYNEYYAVCAREFADHYDANSGQYYGLYSPFRDQGEKLKFGGFTPGCVFMSCTSKYKPPVVDARGNPIVDKSKVYPGVWAICGISAYAFKDPRKKGVAFGLQSVMIIGDDEKFGGGAPDPNKTFAAAKGVAAPIVRPDLSRMPTGQPGAPGAPQPGPAPNIPQQHYSPQPAAAPQYGAPQMPGQPVHRPAAPAQPQYPQQPVYPAQPQYPQPVQEDDDYSFLN